MKAKGIFTVAIILLLTSLSYSQNRKEYNILDENGKKQGYWEKRYENGNIKYAGFFKNDKPIGVLKRYDSEGNLNVEMNYIENSEKVLTKFFYPGKILQAQGYFINQSKDSIWNYYSIENFLINSVPFENNQKHGIEKKYYENGKIYEECEWKNGIKDGLTIHYYENGNVMNRILYMNGILDGEYNVYGLDNNIIIQGQYENNKRDGNWIYYKKSGHIDSEIKYINGVAENQKKIDELETQLLDELEKNKGKIKNPMDEMYNAIPPK